MRFVTAERVSRDTAAPTAQSKATKVIAAFTAWEYSHWIRNRSQSWGTEVQFPVARLAGKVQVKKIVSVAAISKPAATDSQNGRR